MFYFLPLTIALVIPGPPSPEARAHSLALADLARIGVQHHPYVRYVLHSGNSPVDEKIISFTLRWIGTPPDNYRPEVITDGTIKLTRVDLKVYWSRPEDLKRAIETWDLLAFDPNFSLLLTAKTLKLLGDKLPVEVREVDSAGRKFLVPCKPYTVEGQTFDTRWQTVVKLVPEHVNPAVLAALELATDSVAPVVQSDYFAMRALATIETEEVPSKDGSDAVYKDVFGGLYFQFAGVRTAKQANKKKATDFAVLLQDVGVLDDADGVQTLQKKHERLRGEKLIGMTFSKVTSRQRFVYMIPIETGLRAVMFITLDFKDTSIDIDKYGFFGLLDLLALNPDGMEVIWARGDNSQGYAIFNGAQALVREVPQAIAHDTTIPNPYPQRLQTVGCITCHGRQGGYQPLVNQIPLMLKRAKIDIIDDLSDNGKKGQADQINRLARLTQNQVDDIVEESNRELAKTSLRTVGLWKDDKVAQTDSYIRIAKAVEDLRNGYWYSQVDAKVALQDFRVTVEAEKAVDRLTDLLPPTGEGLEDARLIPLKAGLTIPRTQWELAKGFAAGRVYRSLAAEAKEKVK